MQKVEEGIVTLISHLKIKNLVMGAAAGDKFYLRSKITKYVSVNGSKSCQIWFIHEGHLIKTRYEQVITAISSKKETHEESLRREKAEKESIEAVRKAKMAEKLQCKEMQLTRETKDATIRYASNWSEIFSSSSSQTSVSKVSSFSATYAPSAPPIVEFCHGNGSEEILMQAIAQLKEIISNPWPHNLQVERTAIHEMYEELEQAMAEAESKREDFEESSRRRKAARDAVDASRRAKAVEIKMDSQLLAVMAERDSALREKSLLQDEIADFKKDKNKLTEKIAISVELLQRYQNERDEFKAERDRALIAAELRRHLAECLTSSGSLPQLLFEFSYSEIEDATQFFDPSFKFDERGHWRIYRGVLRHIEVAVKLLDADSSIGPSEYRQEVDALSRLRHPNIVTLIGACPEALAIIYEHFPNGSLEDRLNCKNNSSPLPWQTRICIAVEICSVLIFLHSSKSHCLVHGDLRPSNILLDGNFTSKLGHFGCSRVMTTTTAESTPKSDVKGLGEFFTRIATQRAADGGFSQSSSTTSSTSRRTRPRPQVKLPDAFVYMDYEYVITGEYTPELDVYSFGMILLRLLTGKEVRDIRNEVQFALDEGNLNSLLDCSVGDWPYVQAQQLARIALRCTDVSRKNRPDLESEVLGVLQKMKASCQGSRIGSQLGGDLVYSQVPPYYICPINQDVMQDPHVAADGFTYEYDAIQGWLLSSHDTSPMTNLKLDHKKLVPNRALRSAIQEWRHNL